MTKNERLSQHNISETFLTGRQYLSLPSSHQRFNPIRMTDDLEPLLIVFFLQVRVTVLDKNDVAPTWGPGPWKFKISEEAPPNTIVTILKAHDPDTIGTLTYTLLPTRHHHPNNYSETFANNNNNTDDVDDGTQQFQLHPTTGQLRLAEALDRETKEKYKLRVRADDGLQHRDIVLNIQVRMRSVLVAEIFETKAS